MNSFTDKLKEKIIFVLNKAGSFIKKHKALSIVSFVLVILISSVFFAANHFLNKINFVEPDDLTTVTQQQKKFITLSTGETIDITGLVKNSDGSYQLTDGRRFDIDGTVWNTDGSIVFYDGSYLLADGTAVLSDGTTIWKDSSVVFQSGNFIKKTGIEVDGQGYASFASGEKAHITAFTIKEDGTVASKDSSLVSPKYSAEGTWNIIDLEAKALADEEQRRKLEEYDALIRANNSKIWKSQDVINILLLGVDEGSAAYPYGRSDAMIIVSINKAMQKINLISLSRAVYSSIQGYENTRLSHAHGYGGPALAVHTIENNYKIKIDHFVSTTFESFEKIIDSFGGVDIEVSKAEAAELRSKFGGFKTAGTYTLNGKQALLYARTRKIDSDRDRTGRQRKILIALKEKAKNMNVPQAINALNTVLPLVTTDFTKTELMKQLSNAFTYIRWEIKQYVVPNKSTALTLKGGFEVLLIDWTKQVDYIHQVVYEGVSPDFIG